MIKAVAFGRPTRYPVRHGRFVFCGGLRQFERRCFFRNEAGYRKYNLTFGQTFDARQDVMHGGAKVAPMTQQVGRVRDNVHAEVVTLAARLTVKAG